MVKIYGGSEIEKSRGTGDGSRRCNRKLYFVSDSTCDIEREGLAAETRERARWTNLLNAISSRILIYAYNPYFKMLVEVLRLVSLYTGVLNSV